MYTGEVHGTLGSDEDELAGDEPCQFANLENVVGCVEQAQSARFDGPGTVSHQTILECVYR